VQPGGIAERKVSAGTDPVTETRGKTRPKERRKSSKARIEDPSGLHLRKIGTQEEVGEKIPPRNRPILLESRLFRRPPPRSLTTSGW